MDQELLEALTGQRKRLEIEMDQLKDDLKKVKGENREKIKKSIQDIDSKIRRLNTKISDLRSSREKNIGTIPPYV